MQIWWYIILCCQAPVDFLYVELLDAVNELCPFLQAGNIQVSVMCYDLLINGFRMTGLKFHHSQIIY